MSEYIGISEDRLHHTLGVARECYKLAQDMGHDENFCIRMFMIGWNHDVGYEFSEIQEGHPITSEKMLNMLGASKIPKWQRVCHAIRKHGQCTDLKTAEWKILTIADMTIDGKGNKVDVMERPEDIKGRYGENSNQYLTACNIAYTIGLTAENMAQIIS